MPRSVVVPILAATALLIAQPAAAGEVAVAEAGGNSVLTDGGITYEYSNMLDGMASTSWVEGEGNSGLGKYISFEFEGEPTLTGVEIHAGSWASPEFWQRHYRPSEIEFKFPDFSSERHTLEDVMEVQTIQFEEPHEVGSVKVYLRGVHEGSTWIATAISEIAFLDDSPDANVRTTASTASSTYPTEDDTFSYAAGSAVDGLDDTMWCEHNTGDDAAGNGVGEWLEVGFASGTNVSTVSILSGNTTSDGNFQRANRPIRLQAQYSNGTSETLTLQDTRERQQLALSPGGPIESVRFTIQDVAEGSAYNDACITELTFAP